MKKIGGYFELELNHNKEYHNGAIRLNLGRTAFEYILRAKKVKKVFMPYYICDAMLEPITKTGVDFEFYHIDENLEPVFNYASLNTKDYFLYLNYFGLKYNFIKYLAKIVSNLIIDNSQAFFAKPITDVDTFYSPRKFFGVPDGGYLYTNKLLDECLEIDISSDRFAHLIGRIEDSAEKYYAFFKDNNQKLYGQPIKRMSNITQRLLMNINYNEVALKRKRNYKFLYEKLKNKNLLNLEITEESIPMVYTLFTTNLTLRQRLIERKIFVATYWIEVRKNVNNKSLESDLLTGLVPLPIDQRYDIEDMQYIVKSVLKYV